MKNQIDRVNKWAKKHLPNIKLTEKELNALETHLQN